MTKGSLLLVDDDRHVLESMGQWLREQGYAVDWPPDAKRPSRGWADANLTSSCPTFGSKTAMASTVLKHCRENHPD